MLYIIIIALCVSQFLFYFWFRTIFQTIRRKNKILEAGISNLSQWNINNGKSILGNLDKLNELVYSLYTRTRHMEHTSKERKYEKRYPTEESNDNKLLQGNDFGHADTQRQDILNKIRQEDMIHYYTSLIDELQQLNHNLNQANLPVQETIPYKKGNNKQPLNGFHLTSI